MAVEPPTEPAVCTRSSGLPTAPSDLGEEQLGHHHALEQVGRLADDDRVDVVEGEAGVLERAVDRLAAQAGHRDVLALGPVVGLADPDHGCWQLAHQFWPVLAVHHAHEVLLQGGAAGRVAEHLVARPSQIRRAASPIRIRPPVNIGLPASGPPDGLIVTSSAEAELAAQDQLLVAERRVQLGDLDAGRGRRRRRRAAVDGERVRSRVPMLSASTEWRDAGDPRRPVGDARARSPAASTIAAAPSVTGAQSCLRNGSAYIGRASSSSTDEPPLRTAYSFFSASVSERLTTSAIARSSQSPASMPGAGLQAGERDGVGPQRRQGVGVELERERPAQHAGRGLAEAVDERGVDLAGLDLQPGLVERPGGVHLDVRLVDRRDHADRVDRRDERERPAGQVVGGARAPEADVVPGAAGLLVQLGEERDQQLHARGGAVELLHLSLGEPHDGNVSHAMPSSSAARSRAGHRCCW